MNKFELDKVMECFGLNVDSCYELYGCKYYHDNKYFTIIEGKTPYAVAKLISQKYDNDKYLIRVNGNSEKEVPFTDVYTYHIDTIEGLVAFIYETKNYYTKTQSNPDEFGSILDSVYKKILESINTQFNVYDWMLDRKNRKDYFKTILSSNNTYLDFKLRKKIESFDNIVSPFYSDLLSIENNSFKVSGCGDNEEESWFTLTDRESGNVLSTIRKKDGFVLKLHISFDSVAYHRFSQNGEVIGFAKYDGDEVNRIEYNLTDNSFGEHYGEKRPATIQDKKTIIIYLEEYITLAKRIVAKNAKNKSIDNNSILRKVKK